MTQLIEFAGNHPLLIFAFFASLGMIVFSEYMRFANSGKSLSPYAATQMLNSGEALFVDVRDDAEYKSGHVIDARNVPVSKLDNHLHELEKFKAKNVVVYCDNGMRTQRAIGKLRKNGFEHLHTLDGGLKAWEKANLPTVSK